MSGPLAEPSTVAPEGPASQSACSISARPAPVAGRARAFRRTQAERQNVRRGRFTRVALVVAVVVGAGLIVTEKPGALLSGSGSSFTPYGPPITVHLGAPSVTTVTCGAGGTAYAERIPWTNSTLPITTQEAYVRFYEIWDGDIIPDPNVVATVTPSNLCAGSPPDASTVWYVVLAAPNDTNLLTYTQGNAWQSVTAGSSNLTIDNGSALFLVTGVSYAGTGRGLDVVGFDGESPISGSVTL